VTVQREDVEPENNRGSRTSSLADWRQDPSFRVPERIPWSQIGPDFMARFGRGKDPEHMEITGPSGSGKTHLMLTILQDHYRDQEAWRQSSGRENIKKGAVLVVTKRDDNIFRKMGWPVATDPQEIRDTNVVFWPKTNRLGSERRAYHDQKITALLHKLWQPEANTVLAFDEIGYIEGLSGEARATLQQYWREFRSLGGSMLAMKQRPQGALRDMHSETPWTAVFKPKDRADSERFAELLGHRRDWMPVLDDLDRARHEFVLRHAISEQAFISWVDTPLRPQKIRRKGIEGIYHR
jgi:hypothetical protein